MENRKSVFIMDLPLVSNGDLLKMTNLIFLQSELLFDGFHLENNEIEIKVLKKMEKKDNSQF